MLILELVAVVDGKGESTFCRKGFKGSGIRGSREKTFKDQSLKFKGSRIEVQKFKSSKVQ